MYDLILITIIIQLSIICRTHVVKCVQNIYSGLLIINDTVVGATRKSNAIPTESDRFGAHTDKFLRER